MPVIPPPAASADELMDHVGAGTSVIVPVGNGEPVAILDAIEAAADASQLDGVRIHQLLPVRARKHHSGCFGDQLRHVSYFLNASLREHYERGEVDLVPNDFHAVPAMLRRLEQPLLAVAASPPDAHGYVSLGVAGDYAAALLGEMPVIVEVNASMPRTQGEHTFRLADAAGWVERDTPMVAVPPASGTDVDRRIAELVAQRIPDGCVLQFGVGAVPDLVAGLLGDHRDLGIHTELLGDGIMGLIESGAANGHTKTREHGLATTTTIMGSAALYDWAHEHPGVYVLPVDISNDPRVIAEHDDFASVNATMQIDLLGQCDSESLGSHYVSSTGGQADFMRGAQLAARGQSFIVTHSTAHDVASGTVVSRIVPTLSPGSVVTAHKNLVDKVVTEHGVAELTGRTTRERATALIAIADPAFRDDLAAEARAMGLC